jgi:hypothetical protein
VFIAPGERATKRLVEFFTANIRYEHARAAYFRAVGLFGQWCEQHGLTL